MRHEINDVKAIGDVMQKCWTHSCLSLTAFQIHKLIVDFFLQLLFFCCGVKRKWCGDMISKLFKQFLIYFKIKLLFRWKGSMLFLEPFHYNFLSLMNWNNLFIYFYSVVKDAMLPQIWMNKSLKYFIEKLN